MSEVRIIPVSSLDFLGGQYFLNTEPSSFGGNMDLYFCPTINFSRDTAILPIYSFTYSGTKDVRELVGGGTLTRELLDNYISLMFVNKIRLETKFKVKLGYKKEFLKETKDEDWGGGLFDYDKIFFGAGLDLKNISFSYDFYTMRYPNYHSLISKSEFETSLDTTTYTEISENAGKDVLDYNAHVLGVEVSKKIKDSFLTKASLSLSYKNFKDQHIVEKTGEFSPDLRKDFISDLVLTGRLNLQKFSFSIYDTFKFYISNQNSYDANRTHFIPNYYDFLQNGITPVVNFYLGNIEKPLTFSLYFDFTYRKYIERLAQKESGEYLNDKVWQTFDTVGFSFIYPVTDYFALKFTSNYRVVSSNMKYEKTYRYNYYTMNYFVGINLRLK